MKLPRRTVQSVTPLRDEELAQARRRVAWANDKYRGWRRTPVSGRVAAQWDKHGAEDAAAALDRIAQLSSQIDKNTEAIDQAEADAEHLRAYLAPTEDAERLAYRSGLDAATRLLDQLRAVENEIAATRTDNDRQSEEAEQELHPLRETAAATRQEHTRLLNEHQTYTHDVASLEVALASADSDYTEVTNQLQTLKAVRDALRHG